MKHRLTKTALIASGLIGSNAIAGTTSIAPLSDAPVMTTTSSDWKITLGLYGWLAGLDGTIGAGGMTAPVDLSAKDIIKSIDMVAMGMLEARKGQWLFQFEGLYLRNSFKGARTAGIPSLSAKLTAKTTRLEPVIGYRMVDNDSTKLDLLAGITYYNISNEIQTYGPGAVRGVKSSDDWIDPVIGVRLNQRLGNRWDLQVRGDIGGFGVQSDLLWQAVGMIGFKATESTIIYAGYRHAAVDYQDGGFLYDAASSGPLIGLAISW